VPQDGNLERHVREMPDREIADWPTSIGEIEALLRE
jgi:hypothetical protein